MILAVTIPVTYYALKRIWTKEIDIQGWLKKPSESIPVKESQISIVPNEIKLSTREWDTTQVFEIRNISKSETLFSVWLKITAEPLEFDFSAIELLSETNQPFISANVHNVNVNYDIVEIVGEDPSGKSCMYLLIYRILVGESKYFKIKGNISKRQNIVGPVRLSLNIIGYTNTPAPIASKKGAAALQFTPPENMKINSISLLTKKEK